MKRKSSTAIREQIINAALADIRNTLPGRQINIGDFETEDMRRLLKMIDRRAGELMLEFVDKLKPISIPHIGVISVNKMRLTYMELEKDLLDEYGVNKYDELTNEERLEYDLRLAKLAREYKIRYSKKYQRQFLEDINKNLINNIKKKD